MKQAIIFDVGGVLAYDVWEHLICDPPGQEPESIAARFGLDALKARAVGQTLWKDYETQSTRDQEVEYWRRFKAHFEESAALQATTEAALIEMTPLFARPVPGMQALLERLTGLNQVHHIELAICSNNNAFWFYHQNSRLCFERYFRAENIFLSHEKHCAKPALLELAVRHVQAAGFAKDDCVFVDDRPRYIRDAVTQYGISGILFPTDHRAEGAEYLAALLSQRGLPIT